MNLGIIGYRNHSQKIINLVTKNNNVKNINVFSYKKKPNIKNISETKTSSIFSNKRNIYFTGSIILLVITYLIYSNF